jgi:hypothetical protein
MGFYSFSLLTSVPLLEGEVSVRPRCHLPWLNNCRSLSSWSALQPRYGCGGGEQSPHAVPPRRWEVDPSFSIQSHVELFSGVTHHGPPWGWWPIMG